MPGKLSLEGAAVAAKIEAEAVGVRPQAGVLQRLLQDTGVPLQRIQRVLPICRDMDSHVAVLADFDLHVDAAQLRRLQLDLDAVETLADRLLDVYGDLVGDEARGQVGTYGLGGRGQRGPALGRPTRKRGR